MMKKVLIGLWVAFMIGLLAFGFEEYVFKSKHLYPYLYPSDCSFVVPTNYAIVYSEMEKRYAVRVLTFGDYYLYHDSRRITTMFSHIAEPSKFDDSCAAKGYLKAYLIEQQPTMQSFK